ncbi:MAG: DUF3352 domain-containing protein [Anaerolineae bacterium]
MKKFLLLLTLCVLLLGVLPGAALAASVEDLTALASYYPADTVVFAAIRSDAAYLETLNGLLTRIERRTDSPIMTIEDMLNQSLSVNNLSFEDDIRPWLGDSIALGVRDLNSRFSPGFMIAVDVTDNAALAALLDNAAQDSSSGEEYTQYEFDGAVLRLYGNVLLVSQTEQMLDDAAEGDRLSDSEDFSATLALLPEPDYNAVIYLQTNEIMDLLREQMAAQAAQTGMDLAMFDQFNVAGSEAVGLTVINDLGFAIDIAARPAEEVNPDFAPATDSAPLDLGFAARVPAGAWLYMQDTNFGDDVRRSINLLAFVMEMGIDQQVAQSMARGQQIPAFLDQLDRNDVRAFINLAFAGFTGLNFENDVLANLDGNIAMYLGLVENEELGYAPEMGVVAEMDGDASQHIFDSLQNALNQYEANFSVEGNVITIPSPARLMAPSDADIPELDNPALDLLLGYNDEVFAAGTRTAVQFSLDPGDASLATNPNFVAAQDYFLPDAETLLFADLAPVIRFIDDEVASQASQYGNDALKVLSLFDSASITSRVDDDGTALARAVIVLHPAE